MSGMAKIPSWTGMKRAVPWGCWSRKLGHQSEIQTMAEHLYQLWHASIKTFIGATHTHTQKQTKNNFLSLYHSWANWILNNRSTLILSSTSYLSIHPQDWPLPLSGPAALCSCLCHSTFHNVLSWFRCLCRCSQFVEICEWISIY